ncbi:MAG TPA: MFS transporter [Rhodopila sp.]|jgi:DHA2 family methylenomycin A resistance protein-like MFS transporter|nr:MFS transporter [Rhodopila sp.]
MSQHAATATRPRTDRRPLILLSLCLAVLVVQVDTSVANLALSRIGTAFHAPITALQWVLDAYSLAYAALLLSGGLCADLFGRRRVFQAGGAIIILSSLACALAPTIATLIAARAIMGVGAALLLPASLAILRTVWHDPAERRHALGIWASCNGLAFVIGPTLGGMLIDRFGWQSVFLVAVPLAIAAWVVAQAVVPESAHPHDRSLDPAGQFFGAAALGGLVYATIAVREGGITWLIALLIAAIATPLFLRTERRLAATALVPLDMFRDKPFRGAVAATASMTFGIYGMIFLTPLVWQSSGLLTPRTAGLALLPCALVFFLVSQRSSRIAQSRGLRFSTAGGTAIIGMGLLVLSLTRAAQPLWLASIGLALTGIGMGINSGPLMSVAVDAVGPQRSGTASSLINLARIVGATLGIATLGTLFALLDGAAGWGWQAAMAAGGLVQLTGAVIAFRSVR